KDGWVYSIADGNSRRVTHSLMAGVPPSHMVEPLLIHYPSRDGKWTISALLYVPHNMRRDGKNAAIVYVHGGPTSQTVNLFNRFIQHMVNQGYMVIAPNYRGSTGYGKEFQQANLFDMGGGDLQDVLAAADWIKQTGYLDPKKLVIVGGSYGGYMSMMAVTKAPDVWAAAVPIVPFVNYFTEIQNEDPVLREMDLATMGDPEKNKDLFRDRSPSFFIDHVNAGAVNRRTAVRELALGASPAALRRDRRRAPLAALEALAAAKSDSFLTCCVMGLFSHQLAVETVLTYSVSNRIPEQCA